jgi:hypothetical protein
VISVEVRVRVRVMVILRIRLRDRDWVISDATNNTTIRSRDQFSSTRGTSPAPGNNLPCILYVDRMLRTRGLSKVLQDSNYNNG